MNPSLLGAQVIIFVAFFFRSFSGFGGALLSIPLLTLLFPLKFIVPVESVLEVALSILLVPSAILKVNRAKLLWLLAGAVVGSLLGVFLLTSSSNRNLEIALGAAIIGVGLTFLRKRFSNAVVSDRWGLAAGVAGGLMGGMFGTSGPAYLAFLSSQSLGKEILRATLIVLFAVEYTWRLGLYIHNGLLDFEGMKLVVSLLPSLVVATLLGHYFHLRVGETMFRRWVAVFLIVSGCLCLF